MAQADWAELFRPPAPPPQRALGPAWRLPRWFWQRLTGWEDWLTFLIAYLTFLGVALSIQGAEWVADMPNLALMGFLGLLCAMLLARSAIPAVLSHLLSIVFGGLAILWQVLLTVPGNDWFDRWDAFYARMDHWFNVAARGGISNDTLPFVVLVVGLTWLSGYVFGWSVFRWQNPWLGLLPGGGALFVNFTFSDQLSALALLYLGGGLLLVMRLSLARNLRDWKREGTPYPRFLSVSFAHLTAWSVGLLLLVGWLAPATVQAQPLSSIWDDLAHPFLSLSDDTVRLIGPIKTQKVLPIHAFKGVLPFQGSIQLRERNVLSLTLDKAEGLANYPFLRGAVYDEYTAGGWLSGERHEADRQPIDLSPEGSQQLAVPSEHQRLIVAHIQVANSRVARSVLFSIGEPVGADIPTKAEATEDWGDSGGVPADPSFSITLLRPPDRLEPGATYSTAGLVTDATADELRAAGAIALGSGDRYTQLPDDLPQRVRDLAGQLTADQSTNYDKVKAVEAYLRQIPIAYRLLEVPPGQDAVDYFLFESKEGFFDYHASAMVVLLRAVGIPSRLAVGYALDATAFDAENRRYNIREEHAYAWPEVYFPGFGWSAFNPSPERPAVTRQGDTIIEGGSSWFGGIDPAILGSLGLGLEPEAGTTQPEENPPAAPIEPTGGGGGIPLAVWLALGLGAAAVALTAGGGLLTWERGLAGLPYPQRTWEQTLRLASWARLGPRPEQTPMEYARDLQSRLPDVEGVDYLAASYGRSRFGRKPADAEESERLRTVWRRLRTKLLLRVVSWR
jgi:transglutaminase-like putative cysteine protease